MYFKYTNETLNVGSFIKPALKHDIFSEVIIIDSSYGFNLDIEGEYVLDIDLDIFSKDMDYIPYDLKVSKIKEIDILVSATVIEVGVKCSKCNINDNRKCWKIWTCSTSPIKEGV